MERRNGPPTTVTVSCNPNGRAGTYVGYLCFILPEEKVIACIYRLAAVSPPLCPHYCVGTS
eukprot:2245278-Pleurochrysis_carterae.AAC.1